MATDNQDDDQTDSVIDSSRLHSLNLGENLKKNSKVTYLLRIYLKTYNFWIAHRPGLLGDLNSEFKLNEASVSDSEAQKASAIFGPFDEKKIQSMLEVGLLSGVDEVQANNGRWMLIRDKFTEFRSSFWRGSGLTKTFSQTQTNTQTATATAAGVFEEGLLDSPNLGKIEIEDVSLEKNSKETLFPPVKSSEEFRNKIEISHKDRIEKSHKAKLLTFKTVSISVLLAIVVCGLWLRNESKSQMNATNVTTNNIESNPVANSLTQNTAQVFEVPLVVPESLKQMTLIEFENLEDPLVLRLKKAIMIWRFDLWKNINSELDLIKRSSSPAIASWNARKLSGNILSLNEFQMNNYGTSMEILLQLFRASPSDPLTLFNKGVLEFMKGDYVDGISSAETLLRLASDEWKPYVHVLIATLKSRLGQKEEALNEFRMAEKLSQENPYIAIAKISVFLKLKMFSKNELTIAIQNFLNSDFTKVFDGSLPIALNKAIFWGQNPLDLIQSMQKLNLSQELLKPFEEYLKFCFRFEKPLVFNSNLKINLMLNYLIKKHKLIYDDKENILNFLNSSNEKMSWPYSLLGDVAFVLKDYQFAEKMYEEAIKRDNSSFSGLWGLGLIHRQLGNFVEAEQSRAEVEAKAKFYWPTRLKTDRIQWYLDFDREFEKLSSSQF